MNTTDRDEVRTLEILEAIEERSDLTQRHLARRLGVALGLANSYLKRCVRKGFVKIQQAPANRYVYYLTPKGFSEKSRLTGEYLSSSFSFYRKASESCARSLEQGRVRGIDGVILCGVSELAEIASLRAQEMGIQVTGVFDPSRAGQQFLGAVVTSEMHGAETGGCLLTALNEPQQMLDQVAAVVPRDRILVPRILGLTPER